MHTKRAFLVHDTLKKNQKTGFQNINMNNKTPKIRNASYDINYYRLRNKLIDIINHECHNNDMALEVLRDLIEKYTKNPVC